MITDAEIMGLVRQLHVKKRRQAIASLLYGNDTCCFILRQYEESMFKLLKVPFDTEWWHEKAREQLIEEGLREVSPDVWAKA